MLQIHYQRSESCNITDILSEQEINKCSPPQTKPSPLLKFVIKKQGEELLTSASIGPLFSTGGYDWWYLNLLKLTSNERLHQPVALASLYASPQTLDGKALGLPPIHIHHCAFKMNNRSVSPGGTFAELVGDSGCSANLDGSEAMPSSQCYLKNYSAQDMYKVFSWPVDVISLLNDVRPAHSPLIEWYWRIHVTTRTLEQANGAVLSIYGMKNYNLPMIQSGNGMLLDASEDSVFVGMATMPRSGQLVPVFSWVHTHQSAFQGAALLRGSSVGPLLAALPITSCGGLIATKHTPFVFNSNLRQWLLRRQRGRILCSARASMANVSGTWYDRSSMIHCQSYHFTQGDRFVSVVFIGPNPQTGVPKDRGFYQHFYWYLHYVASDNQSHYEIHGSPRSCLHWPSDVKVTDSTEFLGHLRLHIVLLSTMAIAAAWRTQTIRQVL